MSFQPVVGLAHFFPVLESFCGTSWGLCVISFKKKGNTDTYKNLFFPSSSFFDIPFNDPPSTSVCEVVAVPALTDRQWGFTFSSYSYTINYTICTHSVKCPPNQRGHANHWRCSAGAWRWICKCARGPTCTIKLENYDAFVGGTHGALWVHVLFSNLWSSHYKGHLDSLSINYSKRGQRY